MDRAGRRRARGAARCGLFGRPFATQPLWAVGCGGGEVQSPTNLLSVAVVVVDCSIVSVVIEVQLNKSLELLRQRSGEREKCSATQGTTKVIPSLYYRLLSLS